MHNDTIYENQKYLKKNPNWHIEDSPYKANLVLKAIKKSKINFTNMVDIGCGAGRVIKILSQKYPNKFFHGVDFSPDASKFWDVGKSKNLKYSQDIDQKFDIALCLDVFEHVDDYLGFLKDIKTKAKFFIFNIPLDMNVVKLLSPGIRYVRENAGHIHYFNIYTAKETLKRCGYEIINSSTSIGFLGTPPRNIRQWIILIPRLLSLLLGKNFSSILFGGSSITVVAKLRS